MLRVERTAQRTDALTAARVSALATFRDLFPQQVLSGKELVSVAHVTLLTTALVGAEELYQSRGDAGAFSVIHEYFRILEDRIRRESGALVKTTGEGVLAIFHDSAAAVRVALDLKGVLQRNDVTRDLRLQVGVHRGQAMAATLNGKLDYFGSTVNLAMRLPRLGRGGDVVVTQTLVGDPQVQNLLCARNLFGEVLPASEDMPLCRLTPIGTPDVLSIPRAKARVLKHTPAR